jgi:hypothetical protein
VLNSSMAKQTNVLFPDWIFTGSLELTPEIEKGITNELSRLEREQEVTNTNFGWLTLKEVPLSGDLRKLQLLVGNYFIEAIKTKHKAALDRLVEVVEPNILSIAPGQNFPVNVHRNRWYTGVIWLQATNKSSSLYFEQHGPKLYSDPPGIQEYTSFIKPLQWQYCFYPSHVPAGFTPNQAMINTNIFHCCFTAFPNAK